MSEELTPERARRRQIAQALREQNLEHSEAGELLLGLSAETKIHSLEVLEEDILLDGQAFSGPVVWHVTLTFPQEGDAALVASETFPGLFRGHFDDGSPTFDTLDVDLGSILQVDHTDPHNPS